MTQVAERPAVSGEEVQARYTAALESFLEKARQDPYILAVILAGSLSHDVVWERSDIDLFLVTQEQESSRYGKGQALRDLCLVEHGVTIHAYPMPRSRFTKVMQGALQGSFLHSTMNKGRVVFTRDETLRELFEERLRVGARDREVQLLNSASHVVPSLAKAEKWLCAKHDPSYSFVWILHAVQSLAAVETLLNAEVPTREVIHQALKFNPELFHALYTDLVNGPKTEATVGTAIDRINEYLKARIPLLFGPILGFLAEADGPRSTTELNHHFSNQMNLSHLDSAYEWLADMDVITRVSMPVRITERSRVEFDEAAFYYQPE